jgi:hypothetical protein
MKSIRKFAYAAALTLSVLAVQPTLAAAEDARGSFTLSHDVRIQKVVLHPGDYTFSVRPMGPSEFLILRGTNGGSDAMLLVNDVDSSKPNEVSRLVLVSREGQSFASSMALPEYDMTLHFAVPSEAPSK